MTAAKLDADACRKYAALATDAAQVPYVPGRPGMLAIDLAAVAEQLTAAAELQERMAEVGKALGVDGQPTGAIAEAAWEASALVMAGVVVRAERDALRAQLAERPALTAKEVQEVVREACHRWACSFIDEPTADAIAARVAEKLAGRVLAKETTNV